MVFILERLKIFPADIDRQMRPRLQNRERELCFYINSAIFTMKIKNVHLVAGISIVLAIAIFAVGAIVCLAASRIPDYSDGIFPELYATTNPELQKRLKEIYERNELPREFLGNFKNDKNPISNYTALEKRRTAIDRSFSGAILSPAFGVV
jgi:hypothetical protein